MLAIVRATISRTFQELIVVLDDNRIHGSSHWTQATARTQYRCESTFHNPLDL